MGEMQKLQWNREGSNVNLSFDLQKSGDEEQRTVVGFATLNNVDFSDDIVTVEASRKAFSAFRGNVRLQHDKVRPVGKVIDFFEATYYDEKTQKEYSGIKVAVYISKGAEDVWQMCLDGTLSGFSIGGRIVKASNIYKEDLKKNVQVIEDFMLTELSIVDSPANGLANVVSVYKSLDGQLEADDVEKSFDTFNLFWCATDKIATKSPSGSINCHSCNTPMANMGTTNQDGNIKEQLEKVLSGLDNKMEGDSPNMSEDNAIEKDSEGSEVVSEVETEVTASEEVVEEVAEVEETEVAETETEEVAEAEETTVDVAADVERLMTELKTKLEESSLAIAKDQSEFRNELGSKFEELAKNLDEKFNGLEEKYKSLDERTNEFKEKLRESDESLKDTQKRLDAYENGTAIKKSLDSDAQTKTSETKTGGLFDGLFSGQY